MAVKHPSTDSQLSGLDITQLRVLDMLYRERSVRQTAERLCLTPSAISHALGRLRTVLGDELFIRQPDGMHPTARASEIAPKLQEALALLQSFLDEPQFDPATSSRGFVLAYLPYAGNVILPRVMEKILADGPNLKIHLRLITDTLVADMEARRIDLAIGAFGRLPNAIERCHLRQDRFVVAVRRGHPLSGRKLKIGDLLKWAHVDVLIDGGNELLDAYQIKRGFERKVIVGDEEYWRHVTKKGDPPRKVGMIVPDTTTALAMIVRTDMVGVVVESAARIFAQADELDLLELPSAPPPIQLELLWHKHSDSDPALVWLRERIVALTTSEVPAHLRA